MSKRTKRGARARAPALQPAMERGESSGSPPLISLEHCSLKLDGKVVLDDVNFALKDRERWALVGHNGSGKTLFLKLLRGDMWPTPEMTGRELREYNFDGESSIQPIGFKERIAYVGPERQDRYVRYEWNHSIVQVVTTGLFDEDIPRTTPRPAQRRAVERLLKRFKLWSLRDRGFLTLSYGQRRRTLVARAFAGEPRVLLLDEVLNGLDSVSSGVLRRVLNRTAGVGSTWILATHRASDVPEFANRFVRIDKGRLLEISPSPQPSPSRGEGVKRRISPLVEEGGGRTSPLAGEVARSAGEGGGKNTSPLEGEVARSAGEGSVRKNGRKSPLLRLQNVDLYRDYRLVLRDVNWTIARREHWAIVGANGSGKSSLLKLLYGDLHPGLGGIIERERVPFGTPIIEWKRRVGFVSPELQADYFLARDLEEVVMSGRYSSVGLNERATATDRRAARRWIEFFGLAEVAHRGPRAVSYGQMRRALLARAMINRPELLLLDEPCTGLDPHSREEVLRLLDRVAKGGVQLVIAIHHRTDLPRCVDRVLEILRTKKVATT